MTQFKYLQEIIIILEKFLTKFGGKVIPCTQKEIDELESMLHSQYHLPLAYKEFLLYGGKQISNLFGYIDSSYRSAKVLLGHNYQYVIHLLEMEDSNARLPDDIFVICEHLDCHFTYLLLTEGEDPPIYWWEKGKGGLETSQKKHDYFSDYLREKISIATTYANFWSAFNKLLEKKPLRGNQFWIPSRVNLTEGITCEVLMDLLGYSRLKELEEALSLTGLDRDSYLEELSGWKCRKVREDDTKVRFFPPEGWQS